MSTYNIAEKFVSINGEGKLAGQLAVFIRFTKCNLNCSYCDTKWANSDDAPFETMTEDDIYKYIKQTGVKNITLTGGEPLIQPDIEVLLKKLSADTSVHAEIETNGSVSVEPFADIPNRPSFTLDYKLGGSGMESHMLTENYRFIDKRDTVKFVVSSESDLDRAREIITEYDLDKICSVYLSPVFGRIEPAEIVEYMIKHKMNDVNVQLQLHKFIWDPNKRGV
jgi:7-carboxy-7-deazaguanine synthase